MKTFVKSFRIAIIATLLSMTNVHAQWDTIKSFTNNERLNDIFFIGSYGFAVGHQAYTGPLQRQAVFSKTSDGGLTWNTSLLPVVIGNDSIIGLRSVYFTSPTTGYVTAEGRSQSSFNGVACEYGALLKTTDGGSTWSVNLSMKSSVDYNAQTSIMFNSVEFATQNLGFISASSQTVYNNYYLQNTGSGIIYRTFNGGNNWTSSTVFPSAGTSVTYFTNSSNGFAISGATINNFWAYETNADYYWLDVNPGSIARTTDGGNTWNTTYSDPDFGFADIHFPSSQIGYAVGDSLDGYNVTDGDLVKTTDAGQTWTRIATFPNLILRCIYFINDTTGFIGGWEGNSLNGYSAIYKTIDGGITWTSETDPTNNPINARAVVLTGTTPQTIYALNDSSGVTVNGYSSSSILGNFLSSSCAVYAGNDTTFCQTAGQLFATPATPSPDYVFSWSPGTGLSDSTAQNPFVNHVYNQQYVVTMTNTVTLCQATDTIVVSAFESVWGPQYICSTIGDSTLIDLGPGATMYQWQFYQDTAGNTSSLGNLNQQTYWATQQGRYLAIAFTPSCGALTSWVEVDDTCGTYAWVGNVWPGDCNYDLTASVSDALNIGLGYGTTGATRPSANNSWTAQPMTDWSQNFTTCNYKHADCDGNGTIDDNDTLAIALNYGMTHPYRLAAQQHNSSIPDIYLVANYDTVGAQTLVTVDVRLGTSAMPVDSLYGISFRITADAPLIDTNMTVIDPTTTWLGNSGNSFNFRKYFRTNGTVDVAECRKNHLNMFGGNGTIATFRIVTTDNVSGIQVCHFNISDITAVTVGEQHLQFNMIGDSVVIDPAHPAGIEESGIRNSEFSVYPNPAAYEISINSNVVTDEIQITDMLGQVLISEKPSDTLTNVNTSSLPDGTYFIRVRKGNSVSTQKLVIAR